MIVMVILRCIGIMKLVLVMLSDGVMVMLMILGMMVERYGDGKVDGGKMVVTMGSW